MPASPIFEYIPIVGSQANVTLKALVLSGVNTIHGNSKTDRGRLYLVTSFSSPNYIVSLYSDAARTQLVAQGSTTALQQYFNLAAQNASGISGTIWLDKFNSPGDSTQVAIVSFAVDQDVFMQQSPASNMPGYDATYGLGYFMAAAMRQMMTSDLPTNLPYLFPSSGLGDFLPTLPNIQLPDLTTLANADQLRIAQASLVKALSAQQSEHLEEFAAMVKIAMERYEMALTALMKANYQAVEASQERRADAQTVSIARFRRR